MTDLEGEMEETEPPILNLKRVKKLRLLRIYWWALYIALPVIYALVVIFY